MHSHLYLWTSAFYIVPQPSSDVPSVSTRKLLVFLPPVFGRFFWLRPRFSETALQSQGWETIKIKSSIKTRDGWSKRHYLVIMASVKECDSEHLEWFWRQKQWLSKRSWVWTTGSEDLQNVRVCGEFPVYSCPRKNLQWTSNQWVAPWLAFLIRLHRTGLVAQTADQVLLVMIGIDCESL